MWTEHTRRAGILGILGKQKLSWFSTLVSSCYTAGQIYLIRGGEVINILGNKHCRVHLRAFCTGALGCTRERTKKRGWHAGGLA